MKSLTMKTSAAQRFGTPVSVGTANAIGDTTGELAAAQHVHDIAVTPDMVDSTLYANAGEVADVALTEADGSSERFARADHVHDIGSTVYPNAGEVADIAGTESNGTSDRLARADHVHAHPNTGSFLEDAHHAKSHAHDGVDGSGTVAHGDLTGVGANDHHAQSHAHNGADGSGTVAHSDITGQTADDHHNQEHVLATNLALGDDHTISGATAGHVLRASSATAANFQQLVHGDLGSVGTDDHHAKSHAHDGADGSGTVSHDDLTDVSADDHHAQSHSHNGADGSGTLAANSVDTDQLADGAVTSAKIENGTILNEDVNASAAIAYSKLALSNSIVNADVSTSAAITPDKLSLGAFLSTLNSTQSNVTGDGTAYTIQSLTSVYDDSSVMNESTGVYTAAATGKYLFEGFITVSNLGASHTSGRIDLIASNRTYRVGYINPAAVANSGIYCWQFSAAFDMDANDTFQVQVTISGSTKTVHVFGAASYTGTVLSGRRIN